MQTNWPFLGALALAGFFFYKWNEALSLQTLQLPLLVRGYEDMTGKEAAPAVKQFSTVIERQLYPAFDVGKVFGLAKACCGKCAHDGGRCADSVS